ncbi:MAG: peroxiredoxin [Rhodobacteraceae bacterium]|jgi:peroxiredoxin|nr:peroxiredoxin [Paracoccaceae bacterium]
MIEVGQKLPNATLTMMGPDGVQQVDLASRLKGRRVIIFGLPGAFTPTCSSAHLPSFMRTKPQFDAKGVDEIICLSVNDPHVMRAWGETSGGAAAGITFLADQASEFTKAIGMEFSAPPAGFFDRSKRYSMFVEDGVVTIFNPEIEKGCAISGGENLLDQI